MKIHEIRASERASRAFVRGAAAVFGAFGLVMLLAASKDVPPVREVDRIFGVSTGAVLLITGAGHLVLGVYLFAARDLMKSGAFVLWAALNHRVYRIGLIWIMKAASSLPGVVAVSWACGLSARVTDLLWQLSMTGLGLGALLLVLAERRRLKKVATAQFLKRWRETRDHLRSC